MTGQAIIDDAAMVLEVLVDLKCISAQSLAADLAWPVERVGLALAYLLGAAKAVDIPFVCGVGWTATARARQGQR